VKQRLKDKTQACTDGDGTFNRERREGGGKRKRMAALFPISTQLLLRELLSQAKDCPLKSLVYYI